MKQKTQLGHCILIRFLIIQLELFQWTLRHDEGEIMGWFPGTQCFVRYPKNCVEVSGPLPKAFTLFKTKNVISPILFMATPNIRCPI